MTFRTFHFVEGTSSKFWSIGIDGKSHTVKFGKIGTSGQAQTKEFASDAEAKKSYDKLMVEKVKKGYTEVGGEPSESSAAVAPKPATPRKEKKAAAPVQEEEPAAAAPPMPPAIPIALSATRTIDLQPEDWHWATWRKRETLKRSPASLFDAGACLERLKKIRITGYGWKWEWESVLPKSAMSREEAHFWFTAMTMCTHEFLQKARQKDWSDNTLPVKMLVEELGKLKFDGKLSVDQAVAPMQSCNSDSTIMRPLADLFSLPELVELILNASAASLNPANPNNYGQHICAEGFQEHVRPYLSEAELETVRAELRPHLKNVTMPINSYAGWPAVVYLAASCGMAVEVAAALKTVTADNFKQDWADHYARPQFLTFALESPQAVEAEFRRLNLKLRTGDQVRAWLATTEWNALDVVRDSILDKGKKEEAEELLKVFALVKAPEAASHMLELKVSCKAPSIAREWLDREVGYAVPGLIPIASGRGKLAEAAIEYLRDIKKRGHAGVIEDSLKSVSAEVAGRIREEVLDFTEKEYPVLDAKSTPSWLKSALDAVAKEKKGKLPGWANALSLPPVLVGEKRLSDAQTQELIYALQRSAVDKPSSLVTAMREHGDPASLDAFAWKIFQNWQSDGCPSKEKWAMGAIGLLGGDASVLKITPLIRNWPGESQHQRAVFGLECLRAVGSDTALMQLNGIAQKLKFKGLKDKAAAAMEEIAKAKGLTRAQLEDRVVPDCDLDERGSRIFDFGPRQFRFVLGPEMKPMVKDADGKVKPDLPKPTSKDDEAKATEATNAWKLMKKQIKEVSKIQAQRLEQAMVTGRRWPVAEFETLLVRQPLMFNLVRLMLWGGYDEFGDLTVTFRVTEDQTYADAKDNGFKLSGLVEVGVVHALNLSEEQKSAWGEVFSDYEIVPPFPQLGRTIYRLESDEKKGDTLARFKAAKLPAPTLVFGLENAGWIRGMGMDGGCFDEHSKQFPAAGITAVVHYEGTVGMGYIDPNEMLNIEEAYFVEGMRKASGFEHKEKRLKLSDVNPVVISEVLTDLTMLAAKAK